MQEKTVEIAQKAEQLSLANDHMQQQLYGADFREANTLLRSGKFDAGLLKLGTLIPGGDQLDRRGMEWHLAWNICFSAYRLAAGIENIPAEMDISPDNRTLCFTSDKGLQVWDYRDQKLLRVLRVENVRFCSFSGDGSELFTAQNDVIRIWDVKTWKIRRLIQLSGHCVEGLSCLHNSNSLATMLRILPGKSNNNAVWPLRIIPLNEGRQDNEVYAIPFIGRRLQFSDDDQTLLVTSNHHECMVIDRRTGQQEKFDAESHPSLSPDGNWLATYEGVWQRW